MSTKSEKGKPGDLSFADVMARFGDEVRARLYLEKLRWPKGPVCPHCGNNDQAKIWKIEENKAKKIRPGLYQCRPCLKQFTVTVGTIFEDSHIPLGKWLVAWYMVCSSKKGISALQMQRMLGLGSYRTAHFLMHRIRYALQDQTFDKKLGGTVEVDETYIGGAPRPYVKDGRVLHDARPKVRVVSLVERNGKKCSVPSRITGETLQSIIKKHVAEHSTVVTDEFYAYKTLGRNQKVTHHTINHGRKQYVLKLNDDFKIHTNTVESSFSLLKRGIVGTFHHISEQHLPLYLAEFDHRWNTRKKTDGQRTVEGLKKIEGKRLIYKKQAGKSPECAARS